MYSLLKQILIQYSKKYIKRTIIYPTHKKRSQILAIIKLMTFLKYLNDFSAILTVFISSFSMLSDKPNAPRFLHTGAVNDPPEQVRTWKHPSRDVIELVLVVERTRALTGSSRYNIQHYILSTASSCLQTARSHCQTQITYLTVK